MVDYTIEATEKTELTQNDLGVLISQPETEDTVHIAWSQMDVFLRFMQTAKKERDNPQQLRTITEEVR